MLASDTTVFSLSNKDAAGQDKDRVSRDRSASVEAYRENAASQSNNSSIQSKESGGDPYALVPLTIQCKRYVKREIQALARQQSERLKRKVSDSAMGSELLEQIVHHQANLHHTAFLEPTLTRLFEQKFTEFFDRY